MSSKDFIQQFYPYAKDSETVSGVPALVTLAQAALESGWGKHTPGNNFFGIKAYQGEQGEQILTTKEFVHGSMQTQQLAFATFATAKDCFDKHSKLLRTNFAPAFKYVGQPISFIISVQTDCGHKYATDPNYIKLITQLIIQIDHVVRALFPE